MYKHFVSSVHVLNVDADITPRTNPLSDERRQGICAWLNHAVHNSTQALRLHLSNTRKLSELDTEAHGVQHHMYSTALAVMTYSSVYMLYFKPVSLPFSGTTVYLIPEAFFTDSIGR